MEKQSVQNMRSCERISLDLKLSYYIANSIYKTNVKDGQLINITDGVGGLCMKINHLEAVGDNIMVKFSFPKSRDLFTTGTIRWLKDCVDGSYLTGIQFDFDHEDIEYIKNEVL